MWCPVDGKGRFCAKNNVGAQNCGDNHKNDEGVFSCYTAKTIFGCQEGGYYKHNCMSTTKEGFQSPIWEQMNM